MRKMKIKMMVMAALLGFSLLVSGCITEKRPDVEHNSTTVVEKDHDPVVNVTVEKDSTSTTSNSTTVVEPPAASTTSTTTKTNVDAKNTGIDLTTTTETNN
jgi:uncharacterized protein YcfL